MTTKSHQAEYIINVYINHLSSCREYELNRIYPSSDSINNIFLFSNGKKKELKEQLVLQAIKKIVAEKKIHEGIDLAIECMHDSTPAKERRVLYGPSL